MLSFDPASYRPPPQGIPEGMKLKIDVLSRIRLRVSKQTTGLMNGLMRQSMDLAWNPDGLEQVFSYF